MWDVPGADGPVIEFRKLTRGVQRPLMRLSSPLVISLFCSLALHSHLDE